MRALVAVLAAALALSGCATSAHLTGDQQLELIRRLGEYGCGGTMNIDVGGETGQLGGGAHAGFTFNGTCPTRAAPTALRATDPATLAGLPPT